jgi:hypothetical protein
MRQHKEVLGGDGDEATPLRTPLERAVAFELLRGGKSHGGGTAPAAGHFGPACNSGDRGNKKPKTKALACLAWPWN